MSDDDLRKQWNSIESDNISKACEYLVGYEREISNHLARFVASLCDISVEDMMSNMKSNYCSQARWLHWYALRYMTNETYEKISARTVYNGHKFTLRGVALGIEKMGKMIDANTVWKKRWTILKRIIKMYRSNEAENYIKIQITKPIGAHVEVEFKNE